LLSGSSSLCGLYCRSPIWIIIHTLTFYVHYSTQPFSRQQFSTSNILYSLPLYLLTRTVIKTIRFLTVEWSRHIINILVLLLLPPCKWPHERLNRFGGHYVITVHSQKQSATVSHFNKIYTDLTISFVTWYPVMNKQYIKNPTRHQYFTL
jgi:hypothetical protein